MARSWYGYIGVGDPTIAASYRRLSVLPGCVNGKAVCAILAPGEQDTPNAPLPVNIRQYVINSLTTLIAQPQDSGSAKKYVYMKP